MSRSVILAGIAALLVAHGCSREVNLPHIAKVPQFALTDQDGRAVHRDAFRGSVWIANFMFTSCPDVCPILTGKMSGVRTLLAPERPGLRIASFSVDPEHDTPATLKKYALEHNADQPDWRFLTGPVDLIKQVVVKGFKQALDPQAAEPGKAYTILHGSHFVLIDRELTIRGYYRSDQEGLLTLERDARLLVAEKPAARADP